MRKISANISAPQIALRGEHKRAYFRATDRVLLGHSVANALISGYDDPVLLAARRQPFFVFRILSEMIVVNFDFQPGGVKNARHLVASELPIEKESKFFRRLQRD